MKFSSLTHFCCKSKSVVIHALYPESFWVKILPSRKFLLFLTLLLAQQEIKDNVCWPDRIVQPSTTAFNQDPGRVRQERGGTCFKKKPVSKEIQIQMIRSCQRERDDQNRSGKLILPATHCQSFLQLLQSHLICFLSNAILWFLWHFSLSQKSKAPPQRGS